MKRYLIYDTETSGFPTNKLAANDPKQAWIVQFAGRLINEDGKTLMIANIVQHSAGRSIHPKTTEIHGYVVEECDRIGLEALDFRDVILTMFQQCDIAICHNVNFDGKMLDLLGQCYSDLTLIDNVRSTPTFCTMVNTTEFCGLTQKNGRTPKWPKLEELYSILHDGKEFDNAHDALADVNATYDCFMHPDVQEIFKARR